MICLVSCMSNLNKWKWWITICWKRSCWFSNRSKIDFSHRKARHRIENLNRLIIQAELALIRNNFPFQHHNFRAGHTVSMCSKHEMLLKVTMTSLTYWTMKTWIRTSTPCRWLHALSNPTLEMHSRSSLHKGQVSLKHYLGQLSNAFLPHLSIWSMS